VFYSVTVKTFPFFVKKWIATALSLGIVLGPCPPVNSVETNFWKERQRAARRPVSSPTADSIPFPSVSSATFLQSTFPSVPQELARDHPLLLSSLSQGYGSIQDVTLPDPSAPHGPVVIYVQDIHGNPEAQWAIRETIQVLSDRSAVGLVALEGAAGPLNLSRYRAFPDHPTIRKAADYLLLKNRISGPAHAGFTGDNKFPPLVGVDDPRHYRANVKAYTDSALKMEETKKIYLKNMANLHQKKFEIYNPVLNGFDQHIQSYHEGALPLGAYVSVLLDHVPAEYIPSEVKKFHHVRVWEATLDLNEIERDRSRLVEDLFELLGPNEVESFIQTAVSFRSGQIRNGEFYRSLGGTCEQKGISLQRYPALEAYVRYVIQADGIDGGRLSEELAALENAGYRILAKTKEEAALVVESKLLSLTGKLIHFSMTPPEWTEYVSLRKSRGAPPLWDLSSFEKFYKEALLRDQPMAENLLSEMKNVKTAYAVLVAGGHHFPGISERLRQAGVTVIGFVPNLKNVGPDPGSQSLLVFNRSKTPFERLFPESQLFLAAPPAPYSVLEGDARVLVLGIKEVQNGPAPLTEAQSISNALGNENVSVKTVDVAPGIAEVTVAGVHYRVTLQSGGDWDMDYVPAIPTARDLRLEEFAQLHAVSQSLGIISQGLMSTDESQRGPMARGLIRGMGKYGEVPPDLLAAMAAGLETAQGDTLRHLMNGLVQALGTPGRPSPALVGIIAERIRSTVDGEILYLSHGLVEGMQKASSVSPQLLKAVEDRLAYSGVKNEITEKFLKTALVLGTLKTDPQSTRPERGNDKETLNQVTRDQWVALVINFQSETGDALEELTRLWAPALCRYYFHNKRLADSIQKDVHRIVQRPVLLHEKTYFLHAASRGPDFLKDSLEGYAKALETETAQLPDRRYDMRAQMERWAQSGRLLSIDDWRGWCDAQRLNALAPYLTAEEYDILRLDPLPPGKQSRWDLISNALEKGRLKWDPRFKELFLEGVDLMGASAMHRFVGRERLPSVLEDDQRGTLFDLVETFMEGLSDRARERFIKNVFTQIAMDKSLDENNHNARTQFVVLLKDLNGLGAHWRSMLGNEDFGFEMANTLRDQLIQNEEAFQGWTQFKRLRGLLMFRKHRKLLSSIESFKDGTEEGNRIHHYLVALILHPAVSDFKAISELVAALKDDDPAFFAREDMDSLVLHDRIKPSRYFEFARIDLTPRQLARGLVLGRLEKFQSFEPFAVDYYPAVSNSIELDQRRGKGLLLELLRHPDVEKGSLRKGLLAVLDDMKDELRLLWSLNETQQARLASSLGAIENAKEWVGRGMRGSLPKAFGNPALGERVSLERLTSAGLRFRGERYRLRVLSKSDPDAMLTGTWTVGCMSFGTGKNTGYVLNPNNAFLVLSKEIIGADGFPQERGLATSLIHLDRGVPTNVAEISHFRLQQKGPSSSARDFLGEEFSDKISPQSYMGVDSVSAAPSVKFGAEGAGFEKIVEGGYRFFIQAYLQRNPLTPGKRLVNSEQVPVGLANSDLLTNLPETKKHFFPQAYISYTDMKRRVGIIEGERVHPSGLFPLADQAQLIRPLLPEDIVEMSYLESISNKPVHKDFSDVQNEMIAALSNDAIRGESREFLGLGLFEWGQLTGYVLAYAGVTPGQLREEIFVSDFAVLPRKQGSEESEQLTNSFLERVQNHARHRASQGKDTFLVIDEGSARGGFSPLFQPSSESGGFKTPADRAVWEDHRAGWMARWGLSFPSEGSGVSDRAAIRFKVDPTDLTTAQTEELLNPNAPASILDPVFRWGIRQFERQKWIKAAHSLNLARQVWNTTVGPYLETLLVFHAAALAGFGSLAIAAVLIFPLLHATVELIFDGGLGDVSVKVIGRRTLPRFLWGTLFALPFIPLALGIPVSPVQLFGGSLPIDPILWAVTVSHGVVNDWKERQSTSPAENNGSSIKSNNFNEKLKFERLLNRSA